VDAGRKLVAEEATVPFEIAIDVRRARSAKIRALDLSGSNEPAITPATAAPINQEVGEIPLFEEELDKRREAAPGKPLDRLETWKRNLLDLSLRNRLLNFKDTKSTIAIECPNASKLEDQLASGARFKLLGRTGVLDGSDGRDATLLAERRDDDARRDFLLDAMGRGDLHTSVLETELDGRLTDLYRASKLAFEEGGANVLFLCLGFLKWTPSDGAGPYRAPLVLVPVQLERKSVRSGFRLTLHEDETRFNPTLLQMLKQDFDLAMPEFEGELPEDGSGIDVAEIWRSVRRHVKNIKGWEVTEQVVLATLSFTKYLMWKDLIDRTDILKRNPVVRHLIDTPTHTYAGGSGSSFIAANTIDQAIDPVDLFAPLSADSSQIAAVVAAQRGGDFVLFGPPGTGKSQTIANMITNCLAHQKTVLFVSQKTAALEVVRQRMNSIGLGSYCLEVHSTKAQKSSVLEQLATAWRERDEVTEEHWSAAARDLKGKRDQLNKLVSALHRRRANGMTAYETFGRVVADRGRLPDIELSWPVGTVHSPAELAQMRETCADIRTALEAVGNPATHPLQGIEQTRWNPAWVQALQQHVDRLQGALIEVKTAAEGLAVSVGLEQVITDGMLPQLVKLVSVMLHADATDGVLLLTDDAPEHVRALSDLADALRRFAAKKAELSAEYDLKVTQLDLEELQRSWFEACASNMVMRGSRKKKVRLAFKPYCRGDVPDDIGRDLVVLQDLAILLPEIATIRPRFAGIERLWRGTATDAARFDGLILWADSMRNAVDTMQIDNVDPERLLAYVADLLSRDVARFKHGGQVRRAFEAMTRAFPAMREAARELGECVGLDEPESIISVETGWIDKLSRADHSLESKHYQGPAMGDLAGGCAGGARNRPLSVDRGRRAGADCGTRIGGCIRIRLCAMDRGNDRQRGRNPKRFPCPEA
jgi:hypothetical protein